MDTVYDELLSENPFFMELKNQFSNLYQHCISQSWVICIPRIGRLNKQIYTVEDFCAHILVPNEELPESHYTTLTEKQVTVVNNVITVEITNVVPLQTHILFEETFYTDDFVKFKVWCIEIPLEPASIKTSSMLVSLDQLVNLNDCIELLWTQSAGRQVIEQIEQCTKLFIQKYTVLPSSIGKLSDAVGELYTQCSQAALQNKRLREKSKYCKQTMDTIKIAVESYMQHLIYDYIFKSICTCTAYEDSHLNKTIRNLADVQLRDLNIRKDLYDTVPKAKQILSKINSYTTILEKVLCIKRALNAVNKMDMGTEAVLLTADDLLPFVVFLVLRTGIPNWYSQLIYLKEFRFSARSKGIADETAFLVTTLEAVLEHIMSGELMGPSNPESDYYEREIDMEDSNKRRTSNTESTSTINVWGDETLEQLFELIKISKYDQVKEILERNQRFVSEIGNEIDLDLKEQLDDVLYEDNDEIVPKELCHPLCNCRYCCRTVSRKLMLSSPTVSSRDGQGLTALHIASIHGRADIVDLLLNMAADVQASDLSECTALHYAALRGHQSTLLLLLHCGANINKKNIDQNTPLHLAANNGHLNCVKALLYFAENNRSNLDINSANENGDTSLHLASKWGYEGIAKILIENGAEPSIQNNKNKSAFDYAHNLRILNILQSCSPNLYEFIHITDSTVSSTFVNKINKGDIEEGSESKNTANRSLENMKRIERVFRAISFGDIKLACFFMNISYQSATTQQKIMPSCHPLCACETCQLNMSSSSNIDDFDINSSDINGNTVLHVACRYGLKELCEILLHHNIFINATNRNGQSPLHLAASHNKFDIVQLLLQNGADINGVNIAGDTPLHDATETGSIGVVKILLKYDPNLSIKNNLGKTALEIAKDKIYLTIIDILEKYANGARLE